ncbi:hypothetical protein EVAR_18471_1 [Eumeta japonica]|uniref:Uncharacterized protein n=1 Tax=Eumeta variegata TaxID=151549 RepID=A0A4C1V106_EUMVA|nr:hypothetical protein EVAR_18471_1 [Eumeta japonica]
MHATHRYRDDAVAVTVSRTLKNSHTHYKLKYERFRVRDATAPRIHGYVKAAYKPDKGRPSHDYGAAARVGNVAEADPENVEVVKPTTDV